MSKFISSLKTLINQRVAMVVMVMVQGYMETTGLKFLRMQVLLTGALKSFLFTIQMEIVSP